jgi:hypothetical protein
MGKPSGLISDLSRREEVPILMEAEPGSPLFLSAFSSREAVIHFAQKHPF